jgi:hypothetical protein
MSWDNGFSRPRISGAVGQHLGWFLEVVPELSEKYLVWLPGFLSSRYAMLHSIGV